MALVSDPLPVREAGFDIKIDSRQTGTAEDRYFNGDFEMFWGSWSRRIDPDGNIANLLMCEGGANLSTDKYCNKDVHKYLATSKSASCSPSSSPSQPPRFGETMTVRA